jgi:GH24 family phage-related lysozyme (muramidase)
MFAPNAAICAKIVAALWSIARNVGLYSLAMSTTFAAIARGTAGGVGWRIRSWTKKSALLIKSESSARLSACVAQGGEK